MDEPPLKVLIADDEPLATERLQLLLARTGGVDLVGAASDGDAAVRMAEALNPDAVLLDIAMPGLDGIDVARALARRRPSPAVIFITAFDQFAVAAFEVAAVDYLMKPIEPDAACQARSTAPGSTSRTAHERRRRTTAPTSRPSSRNSGRPTAAGWCASPRATSTGSPPSATICGSTSARAAG